MIRDRVPQDVGACVRTLWAVHEADHYPLTWPADPERWLQPEATLAAWVAVAGPAVTGHVLVTAPAEVGRLFVAPAHRGRGLGRTLLDRARKFAAARGTGLTLTVVDDARAAATALYESTGWTWTGVSRADWTGPHGEPVTLRHYALPSPQ